VTVETAGSRGIFDIDNSAGGPGGIDTQLHLIDRENLLTNNDDSRQVGAGGAHSSLDCMSTMF